MVTDDPLPWRGAVCDWLERRLGVACSLHAGPPQRVCAEAPLAQPGAWLELEATLSPLHRALLWLDPPAASMLVDRTLGGDASLLPDAHPAALLDEAEQGVLAYAVARALSELSGELRLATLADQPPRPLPGLLVFPLQARFAGGHTAARVFVDEATASAWLPPPDVTWTLAAEPSMDIRALARGDVWLLDATPSGGWLRVQGLRGWLPVRQDARGLHGHGGPPPPSHCLRVELPVRPVSWAQLADIQGGSSPRPALQPHGCQVSVQGPDGPARQAELVRLDGRIGLRLTGEVRSP